MFHFCVFRDHSVSTVCGIFHSRDHCVPLRPENIPDSHDLRVEFPVLCHFHTILLVWILILCCQIPTCKAARVF